VLVWHQTDPWWEEGEARVSLRIEGLSFAGPVTVRHWRIDGQHSNAYAEWRRQGSPADPSPAVIARLRSRQGLELLEPPARHAVGGDGTLALRFALPLQGVSLLEVTAADPAGPA
jgi:xylan 1,4-beta-xylosidase